MIARSRTSILEKNPPREKIPHRLQPRPPEHIRLSLELFPARRLRPDSTRGNSLPLARDFSGTRRGHARLRLRFDDLLLLAHDSRLEPGHADGRRMANRR